MRVCLGTRRLPPRLMPSEDRGPVVSGLAGLGGVHRPGGQSAMSGEVQTGGVRTMQASWVRRWSRTSPEADAAGRRSRRPWREETLSVWRPQASWPGVSMRGGVVSPSGPQTRARARRGTWAGPVGGAVRPWIAPLTCACLGCQAEGARMSSTGGSRVSSGLASARGSPRLPGCLPRSSCCSRLFARQRAGDRPLCVPHVSVGGPACAAAWARHPEESRSNLSG